MAQTPEVLGPVDFDENAKFLHLADGTRDLLTFFKTCDGYSRRVIAVHDRLLQAHLVPATGHRRDAAFDDLIDLEMVLPVFQETIREFPDHHHRYDVTAECDEQPLVRDILDKPSHDISHLQLRVLGDFCVLDGQSRVQDARLAS